VEVPLLTKGTESRDFEVVSFVLAPIFSLTPGSRDSMVLPTPDSFLKFGKLLSLEGF